MQITLMEDDGIFFEGVPRNVILLVKFNDGRSIRIPYPADKPISALYQDLNSISDKLPQDMPVAVIEEDTSFLKSKLSVVAPLVVKEMATEILKEDRSNIIENEDIVTVVKLEDREGATMELQVGQECRVLKVISTGVTLPGNDFITKIPQGYDVINDQAGRPERIRLFPHEVQLKRKRVPPPPMGKKEIEEILHCPFCDAPNALILKGSSFEGICAGCQNDIVIERIIKQCKADKCGNDVACYDVGGNYSGTCNKCKAVLVVPYV